MQEVLLKPLKFFGDLVAAGTERVQILAIGILYPAVEHIHLLGWDPRSRKHLGMYVFHYHEQVTGA